MRKLVCQPTPIAQDIDEFNIFLDVLEGRKLNTIIEIGTERGGTLLYWESLLSRDGLLITIDIEQQICWDITLSKKRIEVVKGNSQDDTTIGEVRNLLNGRKADLLFIDADHRYECVKKDYENYSLFVGEGGMVAFHDIKLKAALEFPMEMQPNGTVERFWRELDVKNKRAIVSNTENTMFGIGYFIKQ